MASPLSVTHNAPGKLKGASPSEDRFYVTVLFDISETKKYRLLLKILKSYGTRVQKSVFEMQITRSQIKAMVSSIEKLMGSTRFYNPDDNVRIYEISGHCNLTVFGKFTDNLMEENVFI